MASLGERLRKAREERKLSQDALAKAAGIKQSTVSFIESGRNTGSKYVAQLAAALRVSATWLATGRGPKDAPNVAPGPDIRGEVPLISWVKAGEFEEAEDPHRVGEAEAWYAVPKRAGPNTYCLRVHGDSMTAPHGKSYPAGCIIFVDPDLRSPASGARIIAKLEGTSEVTFKVFVQEAGRTFLRPLNPQYPPIYEPFKVIGTVIGKWEEE